jgi:transposase
MTPLAAGARVWLATGHTDMRKGFDGLALLVQETLKRNPHDAIDRSARRSRLRRHNGQHVFAQRPELSGLFNCPRYRIGHDDRRRNRDIAGGIDWRRRRHVASMRPRMRMNPGEQEKQFALFADDGRR